MMEAGTMSWSGTVSNMLAFLSGFGGLEYIRYPFTTLYRRIDRWYTPLELLQLERVRMILNSDFGISARNLAPYLRSGRAFLVIFNVLCSTIPYLLGRD